MTEAEAEEDQTEGGGTLRGREGELALDAQLGAIFRKIWFKIPLKEGMQPVGRSEEAWGRGGVARGARLSGPCLAEAPSPLRPLLAPRPFPPSVRFSSSLSHGTAPFLLLFLHDYRYW